MDEVADFEPGQAGVSADHAGFYFAANQEHRGAAAMVGSLAAVLLGAASKFRKRHDQQSIAVTAGRQILVKSGDCAGNFAEKIGLLPGGAALIGVRIKSVD